MIDERLRDIGKTIRDAMCKLTDIDWSLESPAISEAQSGLDGAITLYCEGKISKAEVKTAYTAFRDAHKGGLF